MSVKTQILDNVLLISIENPPVNALSAAVRQGLNAGIEELNASDALDAAVITGNAKAFSGGADIKEFGKPPVAPLLPDLLNRLERSAKPIVAAIDGNALGGGLETALACHYRVATSRAALGVPEVKLGLIPGAGGTQRLPRLTGLKKAAEMATSGKPITGEDALECGLVDRLCNNDVVSAAIEFAQEAAKKDTPTRKEAPAADNDQSWRGSFEQKLKSRARGQLSPLKAYEAVLASSELPLDDGLAREREIFLECMESDQRKALIHAFFAEREAKKAPEFRAAAPRDVRTVGVLGAGTMGAGIAMACLVNGFAVRLFDANAEALEKGVARIRKTLEGDAAKGRMTEDAARAALASLTAADDMKGLSDADLVIEAIIEKMEVKKEVFRTLGEVVKPGAVLATNTSYLDVNEIASATSRPQDVLGMHFFSPANVMRLLEIVRAEKASPETIATAADVGMKLKKIPVLAGVCDGFIGNRIFKRYRQQAEYLVEDGAAPQAVDQAIRAFGFAMGPFEVSDLAGLDIGWANRRREDATRDPKERYVDIADKLYDLGRLGQKTGAGWYRYESGDRTPHIDPVVEALIEERASANGISRREIGADEIRDRILFRMINEGAKILEEGIAARPLDIDLVLLHGYGFPVHRGGLMFYADQIGVKNALDAIKAFAEQDPVSWSPAELLRSLARDGRAFADLN